MHAALIISKSNMDTHFKQQAIIFKKLIEQDEDALARVKLRKILAANQIIIATEAAAEADCSISLIEDRIAEKRVHLSAIEKKLNN